jgi:acetaldehyde dehydrogenase
MGAVSSRDLRVPCAILGSGNIATDLLYKLLRSSILEPTAMIGIDPASGGLARAAREGLATSPEGVLWLQERATDFRLVFEATSARVHREHAPILRELGLHTIDLTPAAIGPSVVPTVNIEGHLHEWNVNMVTCGGQATVPIVAAVTSETEVPYAEIISTIASRSAGPGTRQIHSGHWKLPHRHRWSEKR